MTENQKRGNKTYELVARTEKDGGYSMKLQREKYWMHFEAKHTPEYVVFENYKPHHLKNLKRGLKLFLESHWPGYIKNPKYFKNAVKEQQKTNNNVQISKSHSNR
jgi:hypothetical protein